MKTRYYVSRLADMGDMSCEDLREAFDLAKAMAVQTGEEICLRKLTWDETRRVTRIDTALVNGEGQFRYI